MMNLDLVGMIMGYLPPLRQLPPAVRMRLVSPTAFVPRAGLAQSVGPLPRIDGSRRGWWNMPDSYLLRCEGGTYIVDGGVLGEIVRTRYGYVFRGCACEMVDDEPVLGAAVLVTEYSLV